MRRGLLCLLFLLAGPSQLRGETLYAVVGGWGGWRLVWFDSAAPGTLLGSLPITGDLNDYSDMAIEFDPQTRELYAFAYPQCQITCPPSPVFPVRIDLASGASSWLDWPGFPSFQLALYDFDIHPETRELRMIQYPLTNYRYSLNTFELHVDQPLDTPGRYEALAHPPPGGAHGGETLAIYYPPVYPLVPHLARLGGVAGSPPASSGEVTVLGPIDVPHYVRGFDISPSGEAYLLAHSEDWTEARLYRLNLETLGTEDLGAIATPSPGEDFVYAIAAAPQGLGPSVVEIPAVSRTGLALLAMLLAAAALLRARRLP
ncbi:MAG: hypothetical protein KBF21_06040 [Thermoanaerobaculia bacterium]|jgi:hypothetical protein|nr:hypothetical protein [Thermoanaerobaculia bacterium]MBP9823766.1 hypothetical protein [Thermoanaerobaculia bacterium]